MINGRALKRTLSIDFNLYTDNDAGFKQQLIDLMIENLQELQHAYGASVEQKDSTCFSKACHKVKTTIIMLEDKELIALIEDLKRFDANAEKVPLLNGLCTEIIDSLLLERNC